MTAHLFEIHVSPHPGSLRWRISAFAPGWPTPDAPIRVAYRWTKAGARKLVREWIESGVVVGGAFEVYWHARRRGGGTRIVERSTHPRGADPRGRG